MVWDNFESVLPAFQTGEDHKGAVLYSDEERGRIVELYRDWTESPKGEGRLLVTCRPAEAGLLGARALGPFAAHPAYHDQTGDHDRGKH